VARHLIRMANEMKLISDKSAVYVAALQVDLGNQVGSVWIMGENRLRTQWLGSRRRRTQRTHPKRLWLRLPA